MALEQRAFPELDEVLHSDLADHCEGVEIGGVEAAVLMEADRRELDRGVPAVHQLDHVHVLI